MKNKNSQMRKIANMVQACGWRIEGSIQGSIGFWLLTNQLQSDVLYGSLFTVSSDVNGTKKYSSGRGNAVFRNYKA